MSGPKREDKSAQRDLANQQTQISREQVQFSKEDRDQRNLLQDPTIKFNQALASGDRDKIMTAAALPIAELTRGTQTAKENIMNTLPPGAARDFALSQVAREGPAQTAQFINQAHLSSMDKLANIAQGFGAFSLQELGAGLRAGEASGQTRNSIMQADAQSKAATLGFLGSLAGAAGSVATGGLTGGGGGKGGSVASLSNYFSGITNSGPGPAPGNSVNLGNYFQTFAR